MAQDQTEITQDTIFDILSSARRRFVLYYLRQADGPVDINELARQVAAWENDIPVEDLSSQQKKRVYISLYQSHIPKLESVGIVEYNSDSSEVSLTDRVHLVDGYLTGSEQGFPWQRFYLSLSVVSTILLGLVWFDVWLFAQVPPLVIGIIITVGFATSAGTHYLFWRQQRQEVPPELHKS